MDPLDLPPDLGDEKTPWHTLQKLKPWHEMVADYILLHPAATCKEIADHFDMSYMATTKALNSDLFKAFYRKRKESFDRQVDQSAVERLHGKLANVAEQALDVLGDKIQQERANLGIDAVKETADMALKALGFGAPRIAQAAPQQVVINIGKADLEEARALMRDRQLQLTAQHAAE